MPATERLWTAKALAGADDEDGGVRRIGITIVIFIGMVLAVACTNLANLVLAGATRQGELAVRMAMGASRSRLVWEQCVESAILAGGAIASYAMFVGLSAWMTQDYPIVAPPMGRMTLPIRPVLNAEALSAAVASLLLALAVFGLEPAIQLARTLDIRSALAAGATGVRPRVGRQRMVIRWQVAIAAGFFIVATMVMKVTIEQNRHDTGVELDRIAVATLSCQTGLWDDARIRRTVERVLEESRRYPGLEAVAARPDCHLVSSRHCKSASWRPERLQRASSIAPRPPQSVRAPGSSVRPAFPSLRVAHFTMAIGGVVRLSLSSAR